MTVIVTGGAGFIGSNFILHTLPLYDEVIVNLDALTYAGSLTNLTSVSGSKNYEFVEGDICDRALFAALLEKFRPRAVINFAAESHVDRSISGPSKFIQTNVLGTNALLEASRIYWERLESEERSLFRFLHISTDEVFGSLEMKDQSFKEDSVYRPNSPYAASKAGSDHLVRAYYVTYGLPTITTNCSNNYGPYQFPEKFVPLIIKNGLQGLPIPIYGDGNQIRDWLHVSDHCSAILRALEYGRPGETYNIGAKNELRNLEVVEKVCKQLDLQLGKSGDLSRLNLITFVKDRAGHDRRYAVDPTKAEKELGWKPQISFSSGLEKTVRWYLENSQWFNEVASL